MVKVDLPPDLPDHLKVKAAEAPSQMRSLYKRAMRMVPCQDRLRYPLFNQLTIVVETSDDHPDSLVSYFREKDGRMLILFDRHGDPFVPGLRFECPNT